MKSRTLSDILESEDRSFRKLILLLAQLSILIANKIPRALETTENVNPYGEKQTQIDVWSNRLLTSKLLRSGLVKQVASEEMDQPVEAKRGQYSVVFDPLDGSSNIRTDNLMGTIVGVYSDSVIPAKGRHLLGAMYFLYGPYLAAVLGLQDGVYNLVAAGRGSASKRFVSDGEPHRLPPHGGIYGIGGLRRKWITIVREFAESLEHRGFKLRYGGSFVGDYNQILMNGGFFAYPELVDAPQGKLRLQFESNPLAFITEKAGGSASTGIGPILDVEPTGVDQRIPTYLGNADLVAELEELMRNQTPHSSAPA